MVFINVIKEIQGKNPTDAISAILYKIKYIDWIKLKKAEGNSEYVLLQKVNTLLSLSIEYNDIDGFLNRLDELAKYQQPITVQKPNITLSTMHSSKGLEFDNVYIIDAFEGIIPSESSTTSMLAGDRKEFEEEVRLFYVAATRARKHLEFIVTGKRFGSDVQVSRFVSQLVRYGRQDNKFVVEKEYRRGRSTNSKKPVRTEHSAPDYSVGRQVFHTQFGEGTIIENSGGLLKVRFVDNVEKRFDAALCAKKGFLM